MDSTAKELVPLKENNSITNNNDDKEDEEEEDSSIYCGLGPCRPAAMNFCIKMGFFSAFYSIAGVLTSSLTIYINSQITTLEKQFGFSSSISGVIMSCNDIGYLVTTLFMSYIARRMHIPRALALATMIFGIAGILCSIPHFLTKDELHATTSTNSSEINQTRSFSGQLCVVNSTNQLNNSGLDPCIQKATDPSVDISGSTRNFALALIAVGMVLQGMAKAPRNPFIATYIDDNIKKTKTALHLGVIISLSIFGPALGYILGGVFSRMHVTLQEPNMTPRDPRWIGAWWLGFLVFGSCSIVAGLPLIFFPRRMKPKDKDIAKEEAKRKKSTWHDINKLVGSIINLITNPIFILVVIGNGLNLFSVAGLLAFFPKHIETQFFMPAWKANIILGAINIMAASAGTFIGGAVTSKRKLHPMTCLKYVIGASLVGVILNSSGFIFGCSQPNMNMGSKVISSSQNVTAFCVANCGCSDTGFFPVCGRDGLDYFSPCHAGCSSANKQGYPNCTCISETTTTPSAKPGFCETDCKMVYPFITTTFIGGFIRATCVVPTLIVTMRSVPEVDKPLAVGFAAFVNSLLGWVPGPILYGRIVDTACLIWSKACQGKGSCRLYDLVSFRVRFFSLDLGAQSLKVLLYFVAFFLARRMSNAFYVEDITKKSIEVKLLNTKGDREMTVVSK